MASARNRTYLFIFIICCIVPACFKEAVFARGDAPKASSNNIAWIEGELPGDYVLSGEWVWSDTVTFDDAKSHRGAGAKDRVSHSFTTDSAIRLKGNSKIVQYLYINPQRMPAGIMLKLFFKPGSHTSVYWEADEEVFADLGEYITGWYMGPIPKPQTWIRAELDCEELEIPDAELIGMEFIVDDGEVWWGKTVMHSSA